MQGSHLLGRGFLASGHWPNFRPETRPSHWHHKPQVSPDRSLHRAASAVPQSQAGGQTWHQRGLCPGLHRTSHWMQTGPVASCVFFCNEQIQNEWFSTQIITLSQSQGPKSKAYHLQGCFSFADLSEFLSASSGIILSVP